MKSVSLNNTHPCLDRVRSNGKIECLGLLRATLKNRDITTVEEIILPSSLPF